MNDIDGNFRIVAKTHIVDVYCPKHGAKMRELSDGWLSPAWWCGECKAPYKLQLVKYRKWNQESVEKQLGPTLAAPKS